MKDFKNSIIVGKGAGISKYLSLNLGIKAINFKELKNINFLDYENIIYTSVDPSNNLVNSNVYSYIDKNFRSILIKRGENTAQMYLSYIKNKVQGFY